VGILQPGALCIFAKKRGKVLAITGIPPAGVGIDLAIGLADQPASKPPDLAESWAGRERWLGLGGFSEERTIRGLLKI